MTCQNDHGDVAERPQDNTLSGTVRWSGHMLRAGPHSLADQDDAVHIDAEAHRKHVEPWLSALLQAEHLNLLVGSGLTTAVATIASAPRVEMGTVDFACERAENVAKAARLGAQQSGRGEPNIEDQIRAARELIAGLRILANGPEPEGAGDDLARNCSQLCNAWESALNEQLKSFLTGILDSERGIRDALQAETKESDRLRRVLGSFLLTFASRAATRERLHVFTTNYDRLIEYDCDLLGLRVLDRFVGRLEPVFRASRLGVDLHYNPPGIRGEPRYLEGVVRLTKLHGSVDWRLIGRASNSSRIIRSTLPFGAEAHHPDVPESALDGLIIYPNPAKDVETLEYPYAELFRDFAAAVCQPNAVLVTYGYGLGDDHINRVVRDMLTIPSTHLVIISYDNASGRIPRFVENVGRDEQITLLIGSHFGDLRTLVEHYLPKPAIDRTTWKMVELVDRRTPRGTSDRPTATGEVEMGGDA